MYWGGWKQSQGLGIIILWAFCSLITVFANESKSTTATVFVANKTHGESCEWAQTPYGPGNNCNLTQLLSCNQGICSCHPQMAYYENGKCSVKAGSYCVIKSKSGKAFNFDCVSNAECMDTEMCQCIDKYENVNGLCGQYKTFGETCTDNENIQCAQHRHLKCIDGKCICKDNKMIFDSFKGKCVSKSGDQCEIVYNYADVENTLLVDKDCVENANCESGICVCKENYFRLSNGSCVPFKNFGDTCSHLEDQQCQFLYGLQCINGMCHCGSPEERIYDEVEEKCEAKAGKSCNLKTTSNSEENDNVLIKCGKNATCSSNVCVCDKNYYASLNGSCVPWKRLGENCSSDEKCSVSDGLNCVNGICECNTEITKLSGNKSECLGLLTMECINGKCASKSENSACVDNKCACDSRHYFLDGYCQPKKEMLNNCTKNIECNDNKMLICLEGVCTCDTKNSLYTTAQRYQYEPGRSYAGVFEGPFVKTCASFVESFCPHGYCVSNARCVPLITNPWGNFSVGICKCPHGLHMSFNRTQCGKYPGDWCNTNEECFNNLVCDIACKCPQLKYQKFDYNTATCLMERNSFGGSCLNNEGCLYNLSCSNGKCSCPLSKHQKFDTISKKCVTMVYGHCIEESTCVPNAFCNLFLNNNQNGHCQCHDGFVMDDKGNCTAMTYGKPCSPDGDPCDPVAGLVCLNSICECPDKMYRYSKKIRKCLGLVGAACDPSMKTECVENAACSKDHENLLSRCQCREGYLEISDYSCSPA